MISLLTIVGGLIVWAAVAVGVAVVLGRMCVKREEQVAREVAEVSVPQQRGPDRAETEAVERSGS